MEMAENGAIRLTTRCPDVGTEWAYCQYIIQYIIDGERESVFGGGSAAIVTGPSGEDRTVTGMHVVRMSDGGKFMLWLRLRFVIGTAMVVFVWAGRC